MKLNETDWNFDPRWIKGPSSVLEFGLEMRIFDSFPGLIHLIERLNDET